ncbi:hypothetical protein GF420_15260 [candidate division GN15 bacterium]|nr:hypothetical protein [candidate division GN15 bacterium]
MRKYLVLGVVLLAAIVLSQLIACSDDEDCPTCPTFTQQAVLVGEAQVDGGELEAYMYAFGVDGLIPDVDSVTVDGLRMWSQLGGEGVMAWMFGMDTLTTRTSGDSIDVHIYTPGGMCSCTMRLLEDDVDDPVILNFPDTYPGDTVDADAAFDVVWSDVPNADYYAVMLESSWQDGGSWVYDDTVVISSDTVFTVPAERVANAGRLYVDILAATGPHPFQGTGNITGSVVQGAINSICYYGVRIVVVDGVTMAPAGPDEDPEAREREVISRVFGRN